MERLHNQIISQNMTTATESLWSALKRPEIYKPLTIINAFFAFQQFSGTFAVIVYASKFAQEADVAIDPYLCTVFIGVARVVATIMVAYILDSLGRRPPTLFSGIGKTNLKFMVYGITIFPQQYSQE